MKMLRFAFCFTTILGLSGWLWGQTDLPEVIPPSPTAAALGEYGDVPVSNYTGIPSISIPLYQIQSRDISVPISLSYHAGGIKVEEEASWVGLGWSLNAGGVITRSIRGLDDLGQLGYPIDPVALPNSNDHNNYDWNNTQGSDYSYFQDLCVGNKDSEPDQFFFNFGSYSGKFVLLRSSTPGNLDVQVLSQDRILIEAISHYPVGEEAEYNWQATTPDGFQYDFSVQEITEMKTGSSTISAGDADFVSLSTDQPYTVNSWYLKTITSPTGEVVTFTYEQDEHRTRSLISRSETSGQVVRAQVYFDCIPQAFGPDNCDLSAPTCDVSPTYSSSQRITRDVYLKRIDFTNGHIEFETGKRDDMEKDPASTVSPLEDPQRLEKIKIFMLGDLPEYIVKEYAFEYDYFDANNYLAPDAEKLRLKLIGLQESNRQDAIPSYQFVYESNENLPLKESKSQDYWGHFNGADNDQIHAYLNAPTSNQVFLNTLIPSYELEKTNLPIFVPGTWNIMEGWNNDCAEQNCDPSDPNFNFADCYACWTEPSKPVWQPVFLNGADREPNETKMQAGILTEIVYPTGGSSKFDYEAHTYSNFTPENEWEKKPVYSASNPIIQVTECGPGWNPQCPSAPTSMPIEITEPTFLYLFHSVARQCTTCSSQSGNYAEITFPSNPSFQPIEFKYSDLDNNGGNAYTYHYLEAGSYQLSVMAEQEFYVQMTPNWFNPVLPIQPLLSKTAGGLRIKSITTHVEAGASHLNDIVKTFVYTKVEDGLTKSSGKIMSPPIQQYNRVKLTTLNTVNSICHTIVRSSASNIPLGNSAQGSIVGYDEVTVLDGEGGTNGKSVYKYFNTEELVTPNFFPDLPTRIYNSNGLLGLETHYKKNSSGTYQIIRESEFYYNGKKYSDDLLIANPSSQTVSIRGIKLYAPSCNSPILNAYPQIKFYETVSEWWRLTKSITREFEDSAIFLEIETDYTYLELGPGLGGYLRSESSSNSDGTTYSTEYAYPEDFTVTSGNPIEKMVQDHILIAPIEVTQKVNGEVISSVFTEYKVVDDNVVRGKTHLLETTSPIANFVPTRTSHIPDPTFYQARVEFIDYDMHGNPLTVSQSEGQPIAYTWTLDNSIPSAKIVNAKNENCAFSSFDFEVDPDPANGSKRIDGNWEFIGSSGWDDTGGRTGIGQYSLIGSREITTSVSQAGLYTLSFWTTMNMDLSIDFDINPSPSTDQVISNGTTAINGWKYYELEMNVVGDQQISIKANPASSISSSLIDELRLHPADAQMSTICYDEHLRVHTKTDINNRSMYYLYDDLGRLTEVRDHNGHLLTTTEYKYHNE